MCSDDLNPSNGNRPTSHDSGDIPNVDKDVVGIGACAAVKDTRVPSVGDVVRLTGVSNPSYHCKVAKVVAPAGANLRLAVRILPNGPEIRVLQAKVQSPACCRMCGDSIHSISCANCFTPADFVRPSEDDLPVAAAELRSGDSFVSKQISRGSSPTGSIDSHPKSCANVSRSRSSLGRDSNRMKESRPSNAELARWTAAVQWTS